MQIIRPTITASRSNRHLKSPATKTPTYRASSQRHFEGWSAEQNTSGATKYPMSKSRAGSPSAERIGQALRTQRLPTGKEMSSFRKTLLNPCWSFTHQNPIVCRSAFNVLVYPVERRTWVQLIGQPTQVSIDKENNFYLGTAQASILQLDLSAANVKKGSFKLTAFGTSTTAVFGGEGVQEICAKRTYYIKERVVEVDGVLTTKIISIPHDGEKQFQSLAMEVSCLVWAQALLDMVYDFVDEQNDDSEILPFSIPRFRFVKAALAVSIAPPSTSSAVAKKTSFLLEEVINLDAEGPFRKYLNNISPELLMMDTKEDEERAKFLAFSQHVQYWKTKQQAFVSDYQGKQTATLRTTFRH